MDRLKGARAVERHSISVTQLDGEAPRKNGGTPPADRRYSWPVVTPPSSITDELPAPGSPEEEARFQELYATLPQLWANLQGDGHIEQTVVVVPSMTLDPEELLKLKGLPHYEERLLFMLILLSLPKTQVVFVTSEPINPVIIDYYLQLLPGIPFSHARRRLHMFSTYDSSHKPLTAKILERPTLLRRIKNAIGHAENRHLTVFNVTELEKRLSVALDCPLLGPDPRHLHHGSKSGSRKLFREAGVHLPDGIEDIYTEEHLLESVLELCSRRPSMRKLVVKINEGFSGEGNAILNIEELQRSQPASRRKLAMQLLPTCRFQAPGMTWPSFLSKFCEMGGVVEEFIEGEGKTSPSVQIRITPQLESQLISTHDQILGGPDGQVFLGCRFPAEPSYRPQLHDAGRAIGQRLADAGVIGRLSVDYLAVPRGTGEWDMFAIEINLRKGGTTHPFRTLQFLTGGRYNADTGLFQTGSAGVPKYYVASDNLESQAYKGLLPEDLIDITTYTGLHYNSSTNTGAVFHMIGALSEYGKLGVTCVADSPDEAQALYDQTLETLDKALKSCDWIS
ncbi:carboxylate-amine ligase [bacterium CPR1]|nr:carboxylate-amine ligase [bacterium CPR1]